MISQYDEITGVAIGTDLSLVCSSKYTYPSAMITWYRDNKVISKNYDTLEATSTTEAIYRIPKVTTADNKALLRCEAYNQAVDEPLSSPNVTLNVWFGPERLVIGGNFEVLVDKPLQVQCNAELSNPMPTVRFNFDDIDYEPTTIKTGYTGNYRGAHVLNAWFTIPALKREHHNKEIKCYTENKLANVKLIQTKQVKVFCK